MKTVTFLQSVSTLTETYRVDQVVSLADATADGFIAGGFAVLAASETPVALSPTDLAALNRTGTREYNMAGVTRQAVGAASARVALPALGASRELYVMATQRCFFLAGDSAVVAAAGTSHPLAADERFHLRIPATATHIAYIRDSVDGSITIVPTAV